MNSQSLLFYCASHINYACPKQGEITESFALIELIIEQPGQESPPTIDLRLQHWQDG